MHAHVSHARHNTAKSANGGENPAHPQGPAKGKNHVDFWAAGYTKIASFGSGIISFGGHFDLLGNGLPQTSRGRLQLGGNG